MYSDAIVIRNMNQADFPFVLKMNDENVKFLSPMNEEKLTKFYKTAERILIAEVNGKQAAFIIVLREGLDFYDSENYRWFRNNYNKFLYIDRVVVDASYKGRGIGTLLYHEVFRYALLTKVPFVTAEVDTVPYNEASLKFHAALGFKEIGTQKIRNNSITVSLLEATICPQLLHADDIL